jgi:hypothetical protein
MMAWPTIICGLILVVDGVVGYAQQETGTQFKLTDKVVIKLKIENVPESVVEKLNPLKDKEFSREMFVEEVNKLLGADETTKFQSIIVNHAEVKPSPTALIPSVIGIILVLCGLLAFKENLRKHVMHLAVIVGLVGAIGGFMPLVRQYNKAGSFDPTKPSAISGEVMILVCAFFVVLCVKSFIDARKAARQAKAASGSS